MQPRHASSNSLITPRPIGIRTLSRVLSALALATATVVLNVAVSTAQEPTWLDQFGSSNPERAVAVAAGEDAIFVAGWIDRGELEGMTSNGGADAFISCYDQAGTVVWMTQFGTTTSDQGRAIAAIDNGCIVAGSTYGSLGATNIGASDAFVQRFNQDGDMLWATQFGTSSRDEVTGVAVSGSDVFVVGWTDAPLAVFIDEQAVAAPVMDAFVARLDADGNVVWRRQFGTNGFDRAYAVVAANGGVYVAGRAGLALEGQTHFGSADVFVIRYDTDGNAVWTRQFGTTSSDIAYALTADASGVYVAGQTPRALPGQSSFGGGDAFLRKYSHTGDALWTRQIGGTGMDAAYGVCADGSGVYLTGRTGFGLFGQPASTGPDGFVIKLDLNGLDVWVNQLGSTSEDENAAIAVSQLGAYVAGWTFGEMPGETGMGNRDAYVVRYDVPAPPEPDAMLMTLDIKPGECPKSINLEWMRNRDNGRGNKPNMGGVLPLALAVPDGVDVNDIDPASCRLVGVAPLRWSYEDVSSPRSGGDCDCEASQPDGVLDLTLKFNKQEVIDALVTRDELNLGTLTLTGLLLDGTSLEAAACVAFHNGEGLSLVPAHPNPFNPSTVIQYSIARELLVTVDIYDVTGRLVERLVQQTQAPGTYKIRWETNGAPSGVYFYRVQAGRSVAAGRMTMIK